MSLFLFVYEVIIRVYGGVIKLAAPFHPKAKKWHSGRKKWAKALKKALPEEGADFWMHCASLGEFEQGRPVLEALRKKFPGHFILLTFFSPSGYEVRKNYEGANHIAYLPLDTYRNASHFVETVRPRLTIFVKYEFWVHFITALHRQKLPVLLISAIFREDQLFFKWYGKPFKRLLFYYQKIFVQDERSAGLLKKTGITKVEVAGDTRFDRVMQVASQGKNLPEIEAFLQNKPCLIAGSTWPKDEQLLRSCLSEIPKWIIAPHEINEAQIRQIEKFFQEEAVRYSVFIKNTEKNKEAAVLIIDNIGMLSSLYKYGEVAYIGGGFDQGIHNVLEAAVHGIPVIFGPRYQKFKEARDLIALQAAFSISNEKELKDAIRKLKDEAFCKAAGQKAGEYVKSHTGATQQILEFTTVLLK